MRFCTGAPPQDEPPYTVPEEAGQVMVADPPPFTTMHTPEVPVYDASAAPVHAALVNAL